MRKIDFNRRGYQNLLLTLISEGQEVNLCVHMKNGIYEARRKVKSKRFEGGTGSIRSKAVYTMRKREMTPGAHRHRTMLQKYVRNIAQF